MKYFVADAVSRLPQKIGEKVIGHCWFVSSFEDSWAFALRDEDLSKGDCIIFLSDELLAEDAEQIRWTIMHEIGHFILGHRNSILIPQTKSEIRKQEREADKFAEEVLRSPDR